MQILKLLKYVNKGVLVRKFVGWFSGGSIPPLRFTQKGIKPSPQGKGEKDNTMKKPTAKSEANYPVLPLKDNPVSVKLDKGGTRYVLGDAVSLDIYEGDTYDFGSLNVYGLVVSVTFRMISKGERAGEVFVSYPQYKAKDGTYKSHVKNFSKPLNDAIKKALEMHYSEGFMEVPEGEELTFE